MAKYPAPELRQAGITVAGEGVVQTQPDIAYVSLGVDVSDTSVAAVQEDAARRVDAVVRQLKAAGLRDQDIRTSAFNLAQHRRHESAPPEYRVENIVDLRTADLAGLGALIDGAVRAGATRVTSIRFGVANPVALKEQAREQAMQSARAKADQLARGLGVQLGPPLVIEETEGGELNLARFYRTASETPSFAVETPVLPGEVQVRTIVRVVWGIRES